MNFDDFLKDELASDPALKREYDALAPEYEFIEDMIRTRLDSGLTQGQLARRCGMRQSNISRLESGEGNPTVKVLRKIADAMDSDLVISFRKREDTTESIVESEEMYTQVTVCSVLTSLFRCNEQTQTQTQTFSDLNLVGENL